MYGTTHPVPTDQHQIHGGIGRDEPIHADPYPKVAPLTGELHSSVPHQAYKTPPGTVLVTTPKIEPQPWVKNLWRYLSRVSTGVIRIDLARPTLPPLEDYGSNLFILNTSSAPVQHHHHHHHHHQAVGAKTTHDPARQSYPPVPPLVVGVAPSPGYVDPSAVVMQQGPGQGAQAIRLMAGARLKITRDVHFVRDPLTNHPILSFAIGGSFDVNEEGLHGVARLKLADLVSLKLLPEPALKVSKRFHIPRSDIVLKLLYYCPLQDLEHFWRPPSRLLLRMDTSSGKGFHITPLGVEIDEQQVNLGRNTVISAAAGLKFPRQLPLTKDDEGAFGLKIHRLTLKTNW